MSRLKYDTQGTKFYETGVRDGVLFPMGTTNYSAGVAWNGLTAVTESPSGAEATALYADDTKYVNLISKEEFGATIEAYTYPDEFAECDGSAIVGTLKTAAFRIGQQNRKKFAFAYKTALGNDNDGYDHGYKIHIIYGCTAAPSEKAYATVNDSPEAITMSWEVSTVGVKVELGDGKTYKDTSCIVISSEDFNGGIDNVKFKALEEYIWGKDATTDPVTEATESALPTPAKIYELLGLGD